MVAAFIALIATIAGAFLGSLIAEDYRRFRTSQGIASALSGELSGYVEGGKVIRGHFAHMKTLIRDGKTIPFQPFDLPKDVLYEGLAKDIGLLGTDMAKDVAYVYQRLYGFRVGYVLLTRTYKDWVPEQVIAMLDSCEGAIKAAQDRGEPLITKLDALAAKEYEWPRMPKLARRTTDNE
jgi:hypothetical protein